MARWWWLRHDGSLCLKIVRGYVANKSPSLTWTFLHPIIEIKCVWTLKIRIISFHWSKISWFLVETIRMPVLIFPSHPLTYFPYKILKVWQETSIWSSLWYMYTQTRISKGIWWIYFSYTILLFCFFTSFLFYILIIIF